MSTSVSSSYLDDDTTWDSFNLDPRLLQAIDQLGFSNPTLIQSSAIPLALEEKEILLLKPLPVQVKLPPIVFQ